jgi:hypothetical protein
VETGRASAGKRSEQTPFLASDATDFLRRLAPTRARRIPSDLLAGQGVAGGGKLVSFRQLWRWAGRKTKPLGRAAVLARRLPQETAVERDFFLSLFARR